MRGVVALPGARPLDRFPETCAAAEQAVFARNGALYGSWASRIPRSRTAFRLPERGGALRHRARGRRRGRARRDAARRAARPHRAGAAAPRARCCGVPFSPSAARVVAPSFALCSSSMTLALGAANGALDVAMNTAGRAVERAAPASSSSAALHAASASVGSSAPHSVRAGRRGALTSVDLVVIGRSRSPSASRRPPLRLLGRRPSPGGPRSPVRRARCGRWASSPSAACSPRARRPTGARSTSRTRLDAPAGQAALAFAAFSATMTLGRLVGIASSPTSGSVRLLRTPAWWPASASAVRCCSRCRAPRSRVRPPGAGLSVVIPIVFRVPRRPPAAPRAVAGGGLDARLPRLPRRPAARRRPRGAHVAARRAEPRRPARPRPPRSPARRAAWARRPAPTASVAEPMRA